MKHNILLITIDCLRADHTSFMGYHRTTTPNLDQLSKEAVLFTKTFATGPRTPESFKSLHTSTYPLMYGGGMSLSEHHITLAELLHQNDYETVAFHSNPHISANFGYDKGFKIFWDSTEEIPLISKLGHQLGTYLKKDTVLYRLFRRFGMFAKTYVNASPYANAGTIGNKTKIWLENATEPFFLWVHYMDPHYPYLPSDNYLKLFRETHVSKQTINKLLVKMLEAPEEISEAERQILIDLYDAEIRFTDESIGKLFAYLKNTGLYDNLLIIISADHGDEFKEHGDFSHATWAFKVINNKISVKLYNELLHVPLLIRFPQQHIGTKIEGLVSLIDLPPTIADIQDIDLPDNWCGESLVPMIDDGELRENSIVFSEYRVEDNGWAGPVIACMTRDWKYIYDGVFGRDELYNLYDDPGEQNNLIESCPDEMEELRKYVLDHIQLLKESQSATENIKVEVDDRLIQRLRDLGYLE
jgi:arylsulfatase A-like enzyme